MPAPDLLPPVPWTRSLIVGEQVPLPATDPADRADVVALNLVALGADDRRRLIDQVRATGARPGAWGLPVGDLAQIAAEGVAVVGVGPDHLALAAELAALAASGTTLVVWDPRDPEAGLEVAQVLVAAGANPAAVVLEVPMAGGRRADDRREARALDALAAAGAAGLRGGVAFTSRPQADPEGVAGWEIGVCTAALQVGAVLVRGIDVRRARRVRGVVEALAAAARPSAVAR